MKAFHYPGDAEYIASSIADHEGAEGLGITPGLVRSCKPLSLLTHAVAQASERPCPKEAKAILAEAEKQFLVLSIARDAAEAILSDAHETLDESLAKGEDTK